MLHARLTFQRMMAIEAVHALGGVPTLFKLDDDRGRFVPMALGALAGGFDQSSRRLAGFHLRSPRIHEQCGDDECGGYHHGDEHALELHDGAGLSPMPRLPPRRKSDKHPWSITASRKSVCTVPYTF